ncbi:PREDICTED: wolframin [Nicrophorus vespilloides]|uniref:Wolframin n=1 Tax=Nicrophorus vespilloides TaxID=110193 RepID=A0ABM1NHZ8_NICVS|nr:PREDICTED: wolframin [Nicrophorus vespilloides]
MAGVLPTKRSTSGRKQWPIHEGPRSSLKRLRNQLANDGCPESQVVLAKQLFDHEDTDTHDDKVENARSGVYWLIKASEQGNKEATEMLKKCLDTGEGICEHNYMDVKNCLTMSQDEKVAVRAAREMFARLSNGSEYITSDQLQRKMLAIEKDEEQSKKMESETANGVSSNGDIMNKFHEDESEEEDWTQRSETSEKLTEDNLVAAAVDYSHGQLPEVNRVLCLNDPNLHALDNVPIIQRSVLHPFLALKILYYKVIRFLGSFSYWPVLRSDIQLCILLAIYTLLSSDSVLYFVPIVVYYTTIAIMVMMTFRMLQTNREFYDFRIWSGLFIAYSGGELNAEEAEFQYIRNNLKPYGEFFVALLVNLLIYPVIAEQNIPQSELAIFAFLITFMTLFGFMYKRRSKTVVDFLVLFSFAVNVMAKYPYETDPVVTQGWRFLDLKIPTFASYIIGNGIEFCLNFRTLLYVFIVLVFFRIAYRENWRGIYKFLIPHCVTLSWLQVVIISSQGATMFGLIRGTLALVGFVLFLPLVGLTTILLPALALAKWFITSDYLYTILVFIVLTTLFLSICFLMAQSRFKTYTSFAQVLIALLALYFLINSAVQDPKISKMLTVENHPTKSINYETYQKFCHDDNNMANVQIRCSKLENVLVNWDGYIKDIRIKSTRNKYKYFFDKLPKFISDQLYCYYGEKIVANCYESDCDLFYDLIRSSRVCTLDKYDQYTFEIIIKMQSSLWGKSAEVALSLGHGFKNFTMKLQKNDQVWFKGSLTDDYPRQAVKVLEVGCITCTDQELTSVKFVEKGYNSECLLEDLNAGLRTILNFLFYPIVIFK